jgi:hypothetical protein
VVQKVTLACSSSALPISVLVGLKLNGNQGFCKQDNHKHETLNNVKESQKIGIQTSPHPMKQRSLNAKGIDPKTCTPSSTQADSGRERIQGGGGQKTPETTEEEGERAYLNLKIRIAELFQKGALLCVLIRGLPSEKSNGQHGGS